MTSSRPNEPNPPTEPNPDRSTIQEPAMPSTDPTSSGLVVTRSELHSASDALPDAVQLVPVQVRYPTLAAQQARRATEAKAAHRLERAVAARLASSDLGYPTPAQLACLHDAFTVKVHREMTQGAKVHQRLPRILRAIPPVVALLDFLVLYSFCADVFNVERAHPMSGKGLIAVMLAALASGVAYAWLAMTGSALRGYRTAMGEVDWRTTGWTTRALLVIGLVVTAALAVLMYTRVAAEAHAAGINNTLALLLGVVFAVLSAAASLAVIAVHALDGSEDVAQLRRTGRLLRRRERITARARRAMAVRCGTQEPGGSIGCAAVPAIPELQDHNHG
jgi:hypothetical protein